MTIEETYCESCKHTPKEETDYCPDCGEEDPWVSKAKYDFDVVDFPVIVSYEHYNDTYGLWDNFCYEVFGTSAITGRDTVNMPRNFPSMKYCSPMTYWKVTETDLKGPFLSKGEARDA